MPIRDFTSQRLFLDTPLAAEARVACSKEHANYLLNVLRMRAGAMVLVFNGRDGEWRARLQVQGKRAVELVIEEQSRPQETGPDIEYVFAPLKRSRLDYMVQKATELGVSILRPVITHRTQAERINLDRMRANVIEAAEQCGILRLPEIVAPAKLEQALAVWDPARRLLFCDEAADVTSPVDAMTGLAGPVAVLIGPEGGFSDAERAMLLAQPFTLPISLGPRIMRGDTAAIAALALVNAIAGDWR